MNITCDLHSQILVTNRIGTFLLICNWFILVTEPSPPPHKRARHGPMFYDVSTNTLFDPNNELNCNNCCRICMAQESKSVKLSHIFGREGRALKFAIKIKRFLSIQVSCVILPAQSFVCAGHGLTSPIYLFL
jgi:hypothetical protein